MILGFGLEFWILVDLIRLTRSVDQDHLAPKYSNYSSPFHKVLLNTTQLYMYYLHKTPSMMPRKVLALIAASCEFDSSHNPSIQKRPSDNVNMPTLIKDLPSGIIATKEPAPFSYVYSIKARALLTGELAEGSWFWIQGTWILPKSWSMSQTS